MKKFLLILLLLFIVQSCVYAFENSIKFVQVTDAHFGANKPYREQVMSSLVQDINKQKGISFVVFTGDNIDEPRAEDLIAFMKYLRKLKVPYYIVLGNHDVFKSGNLSKERYNEIVRANNIFWLRRKWNYAFHKKGYTFLVVDGAKEVIPGPVGYYRADTLAWIDRQLTKNKRHPVVIFQHFPILNSPEFGSARMKTHGTYQPEKYYEVLNKHDNVLAVVSGHFHVNAETMKDGIYHINTPTLLANPPSYKIIDIVSKKGFSPIIYTQLKEIELK